MAFDTVISVSVGITTVIAQIRGMTSALGTTSVLLPVPFFVCLVAVDPVAFGDDPSPWNRRQWR